jgi:uroporphyrinogen-III synthase
LVAPLPAENTLPLTGKHVVITRPNAEDADILQQTLEAWGARVSLVPLVEIRFTAWNWPDFHLKEAGRKFDWLFFTSRNAVQGFFEGLPPEGRARFASVPIAVVGPATGNALQKFNRQPDFTAPKYDAESAAKAFVDAKGCAGARVLWPCGSLANQSLSQILSAAGGEVTPLVVYETVLRNVLSADEVACLNSGVDMLVFTSPSAVSAFATIQPLAGVNIQAAPIACLGPKTAEAATEQFGHVEVQPRSATLEVLAEGIKAYYEEQNR